MTAFDYDFVSLIVKAKPNPCIYKGKTLLLSDTFPAKLGDAFVVTIESTRSSYPQGVGVSEGVEVFGQRVKRAVVWEYFSVHPDSRKDVRSRLPFSFELSCRNKSGFLRFYNMVERDGSQLYGYQGMAMIVEDIPGGRRYRCNDWQLNDDFDDIVFRVETKTAA
jgi:hypothetical protein